jgi:predicted enzyme related to lactoylglutathione lyase
MDIKHNVVGWFEIPVTDMKRAMKFYEAVFGFKIEPYQLGPLDMGMFPWLQEGMGCAGALVRFPEAYKPSTDGVVIYFTAFSGDVAVELSRVEAAGGKVLMARKLISEEIGYMGMFLDTEGNRIALHSRK